MTPLFWCKKLRQFVLDRKFIHFWKDRRLWEKWVSWYLLLHRFCHSIHLSSRQGQWPNGVKGVSWPVFTPSGPRERNDRAEARAVSLQVSKVWLVESEEKLLHEMWKCANLDSQIASCTSRVTLIAIPELLLDLIGRRLYQIEGIGLSNGFTGWD